MIAYIHSLPPTPPAYVQVQTVAPNAGAAGQSDAARSSALPSGRVATGSDNGGNLASPAVPGGVNHAPNTGATPGSFSKPIAK